MMVSALGRLFFTPDEQNKMEISLSQVYYFLYLTHTLSEGIFIFEGEERLLFPNICQFKRQLLRENKRSED